MLCCCKACDVDTMMPPSVARTRHGLQASELTAQALGNAQLAKAAARMSCSEHAVDGIVPRLALPSRNPSQRRALRACSTRPASCHLVTVPTNGLVAPALWHGWVRCKASLEADASLVNSQIQACVRLAPQARIRFSDITQRIGSGRSPAST